MIFDVGHISFVALSTITIPLRFFKGRKCTLAAAHRVRWAARHPTPFFASPPPTHTRLARGMSRSCAPQPAATTPCTSHSLASRAREKRRKREMKWEACALKKKGYYTQGRNRVVVLVLGRSHPPHHITESAACPCPCSAASVHRPSAHGRRVRSARSASSHPAACPCARFLRRG